MAYEVHYDRVAKFYPDYEPDVATFDDPKEASAHAEQFLHPVFRTVRGSGLRIHDTGNDYWLTLAQFNYWLETGKYFGPFVMKEDGTIV